MQREAAVPEVRWFLLLVVLWVCVRAFSPVGVGSSSEQAFSEAFSMVSVDMDGDEVLPPFPFDPPGNSSEQAFIEVFPMVSVDMDRDEFLPPFLLISPLAIEQSLLSNFRLYYLSLFDLGAESRL